MPSKSSLIILCTFSVPFLAPLSTSAFPASKVTHFSASPGLLAPTDPSEATLPTPQVITSGPTIAATTTASTVAPAPQQPLPMLLSSSDFDPLIVLLKPTLELSPLPSWALTPATINAASSSVEIKLPALSEQSQIENYTLTVNFQDPGDGGPLVEWVKTNGDRTMLCSGLGVNGPALGLNSGTLLIPYDLAFDGGTLVVSYAGRFDRMMSLSVRPGRSATVAALGGKNSPAILDEACNVIPKEQASGEAAPINKGDSMHGSLISAELSAPVQHLNGEVEFIVPLHGLPEATMLHTDFIGLGLESQVEVQANGVPIGTLNTQAFELDAPEVISTANAGSHTIQLAGWRKGWLYIPAYLWKEGDNNLLFTVKSGAHADTTSALFLRNTRLDLRYPATPIISTSPTTTQPSN